jgi:hypothetical protein
MRKMTDPTSQWTLKECINALKRMDADLLEYGYAIAVADRIHDLTRWIPVSERMPTAKDGDKWCEIMCFYSDGGVESIMVAHALLIIKENTPNAITHWQRITPPEDKL